MSTIRMASGLWAAALKALVSSRITALVVTKLLLAAMTRLKKGSWVLSVESVMTVP
jgi:hypothetical protein